MHDIEAMCNEHGRQLLLIWFMNYLPLTRFHIVNRVWAISTLIITSCCTCHNYICNLFLNGILAGASVSYGHFSSSVCEIIPRRKFMSFTTNGSLMFNVPILSQYFLTASGFCRNRFTTHNLAKFTG